MFCANHAADPVCAIVLAVSLSFVTAAGAAAPTALVPQPNDIRPGSGQFTITRDTAIFVDEDSADAMNAAKQFVERFRRSSGLDLRVTASKSDGKQPGAIRITGREAGPSLGVEGYRLEVDADGILIVGGGGPGMFYGTQTLLQLLPPCAFNRSKIQDSTDWTAPSSRSRIGPGSHGEDCSWTSHAISSARRRSRIFLT